MRIIAFDEIKHEKSYLMGSIEEGKIIIYPTDTIYGIGCDAENNDSVKKIRQLKARAANPFSVIAPSIEWIKKNCVVNEEGEKWLKKLPGPYTFIFKLKNNDCIAKEVNPHMDTLGVRIPNHWIKDIVAKCDIPFVTTSVNKSGEDYMTSLENLDDAIKAGVDIFIDEGEKDGKPSKIVDLTGKVKVIER